MTLAKTLTVINRGGNIDVRLPKDFAELLGIRHQSQVQAEVLDGAIRIVPLRSPRRHIPLAERMEAALAEGSWDGKPAELTPEDREWLDAPAVGEELAW